MVAPVSRAIVRALRALYFVQLQVNHSVRRNGDRVDLRAVGEDVAFFRDLWWERPAELLSEATLRRGSAALHLLLVQGLAGRAWRHLGLRGEPSLEAPDIEALARSQGYDLRMAVSLIAGGGRIRGVDIAFIGAFRIANAETGVPATAEEGFAVAQTVIARDATGLLTPGPWDGLITKAWPISAYLKAPAAVRRGELLSRKEVLEYFRNDMGGAHHDLASGSQQGANDRRLLLRELQEKLHADLTSGLYLELLSIGQAVGRSTDFIELSQRLPPVQPWSRPWEQTRNEGSA